MEIPEKKWLSVYIFYNGEADQLLKQLVHPFIRQRVYRWFFIRYWEGGDHIRLRLKAAVDQHDSIVKKFSLQKTLIKSVQIAAYEPEIERYGNIQSMAWAEHYFECSSVYILNWITKKEVNQSVLIQAIKLHLTLLFASKYDDKILIDICNFFLEGWLPKLFNQTDPKETQRLFWLNQFETVFETSKHQIIKAADQFWQRLNAREIDHDLDAYLSETISVMNLYKSAVFEEDKLFQIISSFMHMNNNRLGISNYEEAYIMYCIIACLQFIHENSVHKV